MKGKCVVFAASVAFLSLIITSGSEAVNTRDIDRVRDKDVLESGDFQIIDNFVAKAVQELVRTKDFTSIAKTRAVILGRKSTQGQYAEQFSESAHKHISEAFKTSRESASESYKLRVMVNLLILVDNLEDLRLTDLATGLLNDDNAVIRYWAVHCVTNPGIVKQLNSGEVANLKLARSIAEQLKGLVGDGGPEIMALIAEFAAELAIPEGEELLLRIADIRISKYANWTVEYALLDGVVLKLLCEKMSSAGLSKAAVARRFGQLYSYAIQRYVKGQDLDATSRHQLASVLVEAEKSCIGKLMGMSQSTIRKAIERNDVMVLLQEHNRLLGDETRAGQLGLKLNFDYGENPDGSKRIAPPVLPEPPKK